MGPQTNLCQRRIAIGAAICVTAFSLVVARLVNVTLFGPGVSAVKHTVPEQMVRADLVDRNGELIARSLPADDLYARPKALKDRHRAAHELAVATGVDEARLAEFLAGKHAAVLVARQLSPDARAKVQLLHLPGLEYQPDSKRYYPDGRLTAQVVGVTDPDGKGVSGLELGLDRQLRQPAPGKPVATSLDMRVQFIVDHEAQASMEEYKALAAGGLVMDVRTGEILAFVSLPDFDPNTRDFGPSDSTRDIMAQNVYELGSVFKIFSFALGIEDRTIPNFDEQIPIGNGYRIGRFTIHEAEHMPASLAVRDVLAKSSNIGTAQIALRSGSDRQHAFLEKMGLLTSIRTELPETARPLFPWPGHWGTIETATIGFGHGVSVSPLSFAAAAASVVNGGRRITPTFLKHPDDGRGAQIISPETSAKMRELLRYVVTDGTGRKADIPGYDVGGKTGSAEKAGPHGYQAHKLITSFCGVFPIEEPRYLVFVLLDEPHAKSAMAALAGNTAAPLAGHIISRIAPLLGVPMNPITAAKENS
jgi:cell division protein FtsI (penicillin-binding protein 3)